MCVFLNIYTSPAGLNQLIPFCHRNADDHEVDQGHGYQKEVKEIPE